MENTFKMLKVLRAGWRGNSLHPRTPSPGFPILHCSPPPIPTHLPLPVTCSRTRGPGPAPVSTAAQCNMAGWGLTLRGRPPPGRFGAGPANAEHPSRVCNSVGVRTFTGLCDQHLWNIPSPQKATLSPHSHAPPPSPSPTNPLPSVNEPVLDVSHTWTHTPVWRLASGSLPERRVLRVCPWGGGGGRLAPARS